MYVLEAFVGGAADGQECRHLDGNRGNPALSNLCWGTRHENAKDRLRHGTSNRGERSGIGKLTEDDVGDICRRLASGESQRSVARRYGVKAQSIDAIANGKSWAWLTGGGVSCKEYRGTRVHCAKLNEGDVRSIRSSTASISELARHHGVAPSTIRKVIQGVSWGWVAP